MIDAATDSSGECYPAESHRARLRIVNCKSRETLMRADDSEIMLFNMSNMFCSTIERLL